MAATGQRERAVQHDARRVDRLPTASAATRAARMGATVWLLDGPILLQESLMAPANTAWAAYWMNHWTTVSTASAATLSTVVS